MHPYLKVFLAVAAGVAVGGSFVVLAKKVPTEQAKDVLVAGFEVFKSIIPTGIKD